LTSLAGDVRYGLRALGRAKLTTTVLLLSLAVGTGANAVLYTAMAALLFRPPAGLVESRRLVTVFTSQFNGGTYGLSSYPDFLSLKSSAPAFESMAAFDDATVEEVRMDDSSQRVRVVAATENLFTVLSRNRDAIRLTGSPSPAEPPRAVISFSFAMLLGDPADAVGKPLHVGNREYVVAAVMTAGFRGLHLGRACDVWIPLDVHARQERGDRRLTIVGRLADGLDSDAAQRQANTVAGGLAARFPETNRGTRADSDDPRRMTVAPYSRVEPSARAQLMLLSTIVLGAAAMLLLGACVNTGSLLVSRSAARRHELAVKVALGAGRRRLVRQTLVESLLISIGGAAFGLLLAYWTAGLLPSFLAPEEAEILDTSLDATTIAVAMLFALVAGAVFAIGPSRHAMTMLDLEALRADSGGVSTAPRGALVRSAVVIGQVALSTVLLICAGALLQALSVALDGDLGPGGRGVAIALVKMPAADRGNVTRGIAFRKAAEVELLKIPGARAAGWVRTLPVRRTSSQRFDLEVGPGLIETAEVDTNVASAGYFGTMRIPLVEGRSFTSADTALAEPVIVINDILARRYFGTTATGHHLTDSDGTSYEIVGVVRSGRYRTFQEAPEPTVYFPLSQQDQRQMHILVRTDGKAEPVLPLMPDRLRAADPGVDILWTMTFEDHLAKALTIDRVMTTVVSACALLALALATMGVYGVIADAVRRRTAEIGLRVALGAGRRNVIGLVVGEGFSLTAAGALTGTAAAFALARIVGSFVHGLPALETISIVTILLTLGLVVIGGAFLPTWRALRISPTVALRAE